MGQTTVGYSEGLKGKQVAQVTAGWWNSLQASISTSEQGAHTNHLPSPVSEQGPYQGIVICHAGTNPVLSLMGCLQAVGKARLVKWKSSLGNSCARCHVWSPGILSHGVHCDMMILVLQALSGLSFLQTAVKIQLVSNSLAYVPQWGHLQHQVAVNKTCSVFSQGLVNKVEIVRYGVAVLLLLCWVREVVMSKS